MELSSRNWAQQFESLKKRIQNQRINGMSFTTEDIRYINKQVSMLDSQLKTMAGNALHYELAASEIARRETLMENMKKQTFNSNSNGNANANSVRSPFTSIEQSQQTQMQADVIRMQNEMILEIGSGVDRLHEKALVIGEEAKSHVRLLDDLDSNVEIATAALQAEAAHAAEIKEKGKVCYMYICIAVEVVILFIMIMLAFA